VKFVVSAQQVIYVMNHRMQWKLLQCKKFAMNGKKKILMVLKTRL
jgi:hypothetical protein